MATTNYSNSVTFGAPTYSSQPRFDGPIPCCASQIEFVTDPAEREQLLTEGKLSCFNGLRLDGFKSVDYGIAAASVGVQKILFHIKSILANDDPEVRTTHSSQTKQCIHIVPCIAKMSLNLGRPPHETRHRIPSHRSVPTC